MLKKDKNSDIYNYSSYNKKVDGGDEPMIIPTTIPMSRGVSTLFNNIYFYDDINMDSCLSFNRELKKLYTDILHTNISYGCDIHINLYINTLGGEIFSTMSMVDAMRVSPVPIHTIIDGIAASGGSIMSIHGNKRFITKNSYILIHQLSTFNYGTYEAAKDDMHNNDKFMMQIKNMYKKKSKMSMKQINEILKHDLYLNADEALELGLVDEII